ncbi:MAG TPA: hypothetical protein VGY98_16150 [Verrucomicrobiae bacterium]|nr:hypothetical protein [Verrucomicrobiae bacterium]
MVGALRDAGDEFEKCGVLLLEPLVKPSGDALHIKPGAGAARHVHQGKRFFFIQRECDGFKLLKQGFAGLRFVEWMLAARGWFAWFALDPLPDLRGLRGIGKNDNVFVRGPGDLLLDFAALGIVR